MQISIIALLIILAVTLIAGIFIGWNNGKASTISKVEAEAKTLVGDASRTVSDFWAKVKLKL